MADISKWLEMIVGPQIAGLIGGGGGGGQRGPGPNEMMPGGNPLPPGTGIDAGLPPRAPVLNDAGIDPSKPLPPPMPDPVLDNGPTLEQLESPVVAPEAISGVPLPAVPPEAPAAPPPPEAAPGRSAPLPMVASAMAGRRRAPRPAAPPPRVPANVDVAGASRINQSGPRRDGVMGAPRVDSLLQYLPKPKPRLPGYPMPNWAQGWQNRR